jgi:hypothetical protein
MPDRCGLFGGRGSELHSRKENYEGSGTKFLNRKVVMKHALCDIRGYIKIAAALIKPLDTFIFV